MNSILAPITLVNCILKPSVTSKLLGVPVDNVHESFTNYLLERIPTDLVRELTQILTETLLSAAAWISSLHVKYNVSELLGIMMSADR